MSKKTFDLRKMTVATAAAAGLLIGAPAFADPAPGPGMGPGMMGSGEQECDMGPGMMGGYGQGHGMGPGMFDNSLAARKQVDAVLSKAQREQMRHGGYGRRGY